MAYLILSSAAFLDRSSGQVERELGLYDLMHGLTEDSGSES